MKESHIGQLDASAIHPTASRLLTAAALLNAPVDLDASIDLMNMLWNVGVEPTWAHLPAVASEAGAAAEKLLHFHLGDIRVMLSLANEPLRPEKGTLPQHSHYVAITIYTPEDGDKGESSPRCAKSSRDFSKSQTSPSTSKKVIARRRNAVLAHILLTQIADALMRDESAIGLYRAELGVVQPPAMIKELAPMLRQGQIPLPLWVNIRIQTPDLTVGRTLGLPLFGHLDLEILESTRGVESVYAELGNIASYIITSDSYLLPGQTLGSADDERISISQDISPLDKSPVIRIMY